MVARDTDREAHAVQIELLKGLGGPGRVALLASMSDQAREITRSGIRARHPEYSEEQVHQAFSRLILGAELYEQAYADLKAPMP